MPYKTKPNLISIYPFFISSDLYVIWKIKCSILAPPPQKKKHFPGLHYPQDSTPLQCHN